MLLKAQKAVPRSLTLSQHWENVWKEDIALLEFENLLGGFRKEEAAIDSSSKLKLLEDKIKYLDRDLIESRFTSEEFADLLEDALPYAARALSEERREYIANLLKNCLTHEELDHAGKKKLLAF